MSVISKEQLAMLRNAFPVGSKVKLDNMDDCQAPPVGTTGHVICVDDYGTIHVQWADGSTLGVAYPEDKCHRVYA